jgi:hypothetical protein
MAILLILDVWLVLSVRHRERIPVRLVVGGCQSYAVEAQWSSRRLLISWLWVRVPSAVPPDGSYGYVVGPTRLV